MLEKILLSSSTKNAWGKIGVSHHHGINTPIFSLRTENSLGIGEFLDLIPLIDWASSLGLKVIQILPINDTGMSPSPYNALSSLALNPTYLSLSAIDGAKSIPSYLETKKRLQAFDQEKRVLYSLIRKEKLRFLHEYFLRFSEDTKGFVAKIIKKEPWVKIYALFMALKEKNGLMSWLYWPDQEKNPIDLEKLYEEQKSVWPFYAFLQYLCFEQMRLVKKHAEKRQVFLKGDIPILLSPDSTDVWYERENFCLDYTTGCPPDLFNYEGQNWGFPLFSWEYLQKTKYAWWKRRLQVAEKFFHIYRIDHLVGFFRIWAIPIGKAPVKGAFFSPNRKIWYFHAKERIEALIEASSMLPIGEDLGIMPKEARGLLKTLGVSGTRITRWVKYWEEDGSFIPSKDFDPLSVTTLSSHDTSTFGQWWKENPSEAKLYAESRNIPYEKTLSPSLREKCLEDAHKSSSLFHINLLFEYLAVFPEFSLKNPKDERINCPGTESLENWSIRYPVKIETLQEHIPMRNLFKRLIP